MNIKKILPNKMAKIGAGVVIGGMAPLLVIIFLAKVGIWPDPNPNPIGPGLLVFSTFWPGIILYGIGLFRGRKPTDFSDL